MLVWTASKIGHYSDSVLTAESDNTFDIGQNTYNDTSVKAAKLAIANYANKTVIQVFFDSEPAVFVQPYTNIALDCAPYTKCRIVNGGGKKISIRFIDMAMFNAMPGLFAAFPIQIPASGNDILMHFDDRANTNDGTLDAGIEIIPTCLIDTTTKKFGASSLNCNGGGLIVGRTNAFDTAADFTCDAWIKHDVSGWTIGTYRYIFQIGSDTPFISISARLYRVDATKMRVALNLNGGLATSADYVFNYSDFVHFALTKKGNTMRFFENGVSLASVTKASTAVLPSFFLGCGQVAGTDYNIVANIDEWRFAKDICLWTNDFTPPGKPYI